VIAGTRARADATVQMERGTLVSDTIVVLMGVAHLREISRELIAGGRAPETPVAIIRWGSYEGQQTITGSLSTIADDAEHAGLRPPAVIVIGEVVKLRERLKWFEERASGYACGDLEVAEFGSAVAITNGMS